MALLERPSLSLMAEDTAGALEEEINRCKVGDHGVEVEIERLLYDLGRDENGLFRALISAKGLADFFLDALPVFIEEPCVEERHDGTILLFQLQIGLLCLIDGIAEYADTALAVGHAE